jgi:hypothetical protein
MPLAYAHIVQVLVDLVLVLYPFMAYSSGMSGFVCVLGTGLLTIGYQGLVRIAAQLVRMQSLLRLTFLLCTHSLISPSNFSIRTTMKTTAKGKTHWWSTR